VARRAVQRHAGQDQDDEGEAGWSHGTDGMQLRPAALGPLSESVSGSRPARRGVGALSLQRDKRRDEVGRRAGAGGGRARGELGCCITASAAARCGGGGGAGDRRVEAAGRRQRRSEADAHCYLALRPACSPRGRRRCRRRRLDRRLGGRPSSSSDVTHLRLPRPAGGAEEATASRRAGAAAPTHMQRRGGRL
jgi:hypothetical protein